MDAILDEDRQQDNTVIYSLEDFGDFVRSLRDRCRNLTEVEWCRTAKYSCCTWEDEIAFRCRDPG